MRTTLYFCKIFENVLVKSSDTESQSYHCHDSEWNYIPGLYNIEKASASGESGSEMRNSNSHHEGYIGLYANEPVADEDWLANYCEKSKHTTNGSRNYN